MELEPTRIGGKYEILRELGSGGSATVYLAREVATELGAERLVAIKVLRDDGTMSDARQRFSQEIRVMANLRHPHIVPLFDTGIWDGRPYLVMPYIEGESLAARIKCEGKLSVEAVVKMGIQVCEALDYAHSQHLVHRDVKPSNILFDANGNAWLSDFGVARWTELTGDDRPTRSSAGAPGTMAYASPEQIAGERHLDARTDVYALGVVLYEATTGKLPFGHTTPREFLLQKLGGTSPAPPSPDSPMTRPLQSVVERAVAPEPSARWSTCGAFKEALIKLQVAPFVVSRSPIAWSAAAATALVAGILGGAVWALGTPTPGANRIAIVGLAEEAALAPSAAELERRLRRYTDLEVVHVPSTAHGDPLDRGTVAAARNAGAGRMIVITPSSARETRRVVVLSLDGDQPQVRRSFGLPFRSSASPTESAYDVAWASLIDSVLFGDSEASSASSQVGTTLAVAREHFLRGYQHLNHWRLAAADSSFSAALASDPKYTEAATWLAQVRMWADSSLTSWEPHLVRSTAFGRPLSGRTTRLLAALGPASRKDWGNACGAYRAMIEADSLDFAAWIGAGECWRRDDAVLQDARSLSGWRFQSSMRSALDAYRRAFAMMPRSGAAFQADEFATLRRLMYTHSRHVRVGRAPTDGRLFAAPPSWDVFADTIQFIPYPVEQLADKTPETIGLAVARNREFFFQVVQRWVSADSLNPQALEALAIAQEQQADESAVFTLERALARAPSLEYRSRLQAHLVHTLIRFGAPDGLENLERARTLGGRLLRGVDFAGPEAAAIAILLGRDPTAALQGAARPRSLPLQGGRFSLSPGLSFRVERLTVFAALGSPFDSLASGVRTVMAELASTMGENQAAAAAPLLFARASQMAFMSAGRHLIAARPDDPNDLVRAQELLVRGDTAAVRRVLSAIANTRRHIPRGDVSLDAVIVEADLMRRLGDTKGAAVWLADALGALKFAEPGAYSNPVLAASLVRAARLAVDLAEGMRDARTAANWRRFLSTLSRQ